MFIVMLSPYAGVGLRVEWILAGRRIFPFDLSAGPGFSITMDGWQNRLASRWDDVRERWGLRELLSPLLLLVFFLLLLLPALGWYWSREPARFELPAARGPAGTRLVATQARMVDVLLGKPGGFLNNDMLPPGSMIDDIPAWERGVLRQMRDFAEILSAPDDAGGSPDLVEAAAALAVAPEAWGLPSVEGELGRARGALERHGRRLAGPGGGAPGLREAQLRRWLAVLQLRLEDLAVRLNAAQSASLAPRAPLPAGTEVVPASSWSQVDDIFFEARGGAWAQLHLLKAAEADFAPLLARHRADLGLRAAIHELEATQQPLWSPVVLNGSGFGLFANHSLVLANYLHRARSELAEVQVLLGRTP